MSVKSCLAALLLALLATPARGEDPTPSAEHAPTPQPTRSESAPGSEPAERVVVGGMVSPTGDPSEIPEDNVVHWTEVAVKARPQVFESDYPKEAIERGLPAERCNLRLYVDEQGMPYDVKPRTCSEVFFPSARDIAMRYRFYPVQVAGKPTKVEFDLQLNFKPPPVELAPGGG